MSYLKAIIVNFIILSVFFVLVLLLLNVDSWLGLKDYRSMPTSIVGWLLVVSGIVLRLWAFGAGRKNLADGDEYGSDGENRSATSRAEPLTIDGPFARTRNPFELGAIFLALGLVITLGSYASLILPILVFLVLDAWIRSKEKDLEVTFGNHFLEYKNSVPRWLWRK